MISLACLDRFGKSKVIELKQNDETSNSVAQRWF